MRTTQNISAPILYLFLFGVLLNFNLAAQSNPNPCSSVGVSCVGSGGDSVITSFGSSLAIYPAPNTSMPFWVAIKNSTNGSIDTSVTSPITITKISGPGTLTGTTAQILTKYIYFNDFKFSTSGTYVLEINVVGYPKKTIQLEVLEEFDLCSVSPSGICNSNGGNALFAHAKNGGIIPVDAVFPVIVGLIDTLTGQIDNSFFSRIFVEKLSGPGNLYGTLSMHGAKWLYFNNIKFDQDGDYIIRFYSDGYASDTLAVKVTSTANIITEINTISLAIFPNPSNNVVTITASNNYSNGVVSVYDSGGKLVITKNISLNNESSLQLRTQSLQSGMYFVELLNIETNKKERGILLKK